MWKVPSRRWPQSASDGLHAAGDTWGVQSAVAQLLYPSYTRRLFTRRPLVNYRVLLGVPAVIAMAVLAFAAVRLTGGSPNTLNHLGYGPIIVAAYLFGVRGALPAAILIGLLLGPAAGLVPDHFEPLDSWLPRFAAFVAVGLVVGGLFDLAHRSAERWHGAAVEIAAREREGMVALARGAEAKDTDTGEHILRVQVISEELALATGMSNTEAAALGWSAMLHDVGKLHIPDRILLKPGPLNTEEWEIMRRHPIYGETILGDGPGFATARRVARWHHENFDGTGYPDGLGAEAIPLDARIVRIADSFDAMTNTRPYKEAESIEWALAELRRCSGTHFDPELVRLFRDLVEGSSGFVARLAAHRSGALGVHSLISPAGAEVKPQASE